jgi:hypothetical protein
MLTTRGPGAPGFLIKICFEGALESRNGRLTSPIGVQFDRFESFLLRWIRARFTAIRSFSIRELGSTQTVLGT